MKEAIKERITRQDREELIELEMRLATLSVQARDIADASGFGRRAIAARMGNASPSTLQRLLKGMAYNASLDTIARFAWACGYELQMGFVPKSEAKPERSTQGAATSVQVGVADVLNLRDYAQHVAPRRAPWHQQYANNSNFDELDYGDRRASNGT